MIPGCPPVPFSKGLRRSAINLDTFVETAVYSVFMHYFGRQAPKLREIGE